MFYDDDDSLYLMYTHSRCWTHVLIDKSPLSLFSFLYQFINILPYHFWRYYNSISSNSFLISSKYLTVIFTITSQLSSVNLTIILQLYYNSLDWSMHYDTGVQYYRTNHLPPLQTPYK